MWFIVESQLLANLRNDVSRATPRAETRTGAPGASSDLRPSWAEEIRFHRVEQRSSGKPARKGSEVFRAMDRSGRGTYRIDFISSSAFQRRRCAPGETAAATSPRISVNDRAPRFICLLLSLRSPPFSEANRELGRFLIFREVLCVASSTRGIGMYDKGVRFCHSIVAQSLDVRFKY